MSFFAPAAPRTVWSFFPHAMIGALAVVVAVNAGMIYAALHTFPGVAATDVFDHSNAYDAVLRLSAQEAALGWTIEVDVVGAMPTLRLTGRDGQALSGGHLTADARRPVGPDQKTDLGFIEASSGRYVADRALPARGQWDLRLTVAQGGGVVHATRRVLVK
jgi:nitrogen fixation protein FixH